MKSVDKFALHNFGFENEYAQPEQVHDTYAEKGTTSAHEERREVAIRGAL